MRILSETSRAVEARVVLRLNAWEEFLSIQQHQWAIAASCPDDWGHLIEQCGGGFFHSPAGLWSGMPDGAPFFARLARGTRTAGIALGVRRRCSLSKHARHVYLPTLPALGDAVSRDAALAGLVRTLAGQGSAEVVIDSFDARWSPNGASGAASITPRQEYVVRLEPGCTAEALARRCAAGQRRHLRRGERDGWVVRMLAGDEARGALAHVQHVASSRAADRGNGFVPYAPRSSTELAGAALDAPWGMLTLAAFRGDVLLCAALIGFAGKRAFYCVGGSTPEGYHASAASWLHWRIMRVLAEHGYTAYNLGGTPASAAQPDDPAHGLFRFKTGMGADVVPCAGACWVFSPIHLRAHGLARRLIAPFHA